MRMARFNALVLFFLLATGFSFAADSGLKYWRIGNRKDVSTKTTAGYALMGFVVLSNDGIRAMMFYLTAYYLMDAGAFLVVMIVANETGNEDIEAYRGLAWRGGLVVRG